MPEPSSFAARTSWKCGRGIAPRVSIALLIAALAAAQPPSPQADALEAQGKFADAEPFYREALAAQEKETSAEDSKLVPILVALGRNLAVQMKLPDARRRLRPAALPRTKPSEAAP